MRFQCIGLILLFILNGCSRYIDRENINYTNLDRIEISEKNENRSLPKLIKKYKYIKLETTPKCLIGKIDKFISSDNKFYILDAKAKAIFIFNTKGQFLSKIYRPGRGPGEYSYIMDFDVDKYGNVYLVDLYKKAILKYNFKGDFVKKYKQNYSVNNLAVIDTSLFLTYQATAFQSDEKDKLIFLKNNQKYTSFFPVNKNSNTLTLLKPFSITRSNELLYNSDLSDTIFKVSVDGLDARYFLDFGKNSIPDNLRNNYKYFMKGVQFINEGWRISNYFELSDYFTCSFNFKGKSWFLFYSKKTKKNMIISCPNCDLERLKIISNFKPIGVFNDFFVSNLDYHLVKIYKEGLKKDPIRARDFLGMENINMINSFKENDNPILVLYQLGEL